MRLKRHVVWASVALIVVLAGAVGVVYYRVVWRWSPLTLVVRSFLEAARAGDTAALRSAATDDEPVRRALAMAHGRPDQFDTLIASLRIANGVPQGSEGVTAAFRTHSNFCGFADGHSEVFTARFVLQGGKWRIAYAGIAPC